MTEDRRKEARPQAPQRRYEDVKAASASATERITRAAEELTQALRSFNPEQGKAA